MNILILSWRGPGHPMSGGAEQATWAHARGWLKAGHKVTLFTSVFRDCKSQEKLEGIEIIRKGIDIFGVQLCAFWWYIFGNHTRFDLVVDEFHGIPFFTPIYVRVKKLGYIHEVAQKVWSLNPWPKPFNLIPAIIGKIGEPLVFKLLYTHIPFMTVSESTKSDLQTFGVRDITIVYNGVNLPSKLPNHPKEKIFTVIYLSPLTKDKGIEDAIIAFKKFTENNPNSQMWIVGKGENNYLKTLEHMTKNCPINFFGYISESMKFGLLSRAHLLLNPSIHEGWGLVNIEANACGTPVVGYDVSGIRDSVINDKTGILVDERNTDQLSLAIANVKKGLINNSECKKWARKFSWEDSTRKSIHLLQQIINTHNN